MALPRVLFVDDEPMLLSGLQRGLRYMRHEWAMEFASSGTAALALMEAAPVDVIVSDMLMPEMSGAQLLDEVRSRHPRTVRFILSGQFDSDSILRTLNPAHQYLAKPCAPEELCRKIRAALELRAVLAEGHLKEVVSRVKSLPSLPTVYQELLSKISSPDSSTKDVGAIIERDMAMTSKVLQLVNSAFFGVGSHVTSSAQAVQFLGTATITSLVLSLEIFSQLEVFGPMADQFSRLWSHGIAVSRVSQAIGRLSGLPDDGVKGCFTAGLLHDIGVLILASECANELSQAIAVAQAEKLSLWDAEYKVLGCSHAEIGAYLLGIWGLPTEIVAAVAWHHKPSRSPIDAPSPLLATHLADCAHRGLDPYCGLECAPVDTVFCTRCGVEDKYAGWVEEAVSITQPW